tara:strand:- start:738 stop:1424 length:687 start_codon:yes stop_codon:yes gene_type:complete
MNPDKFKKLTADISWYSVSTYHRLNLYLSDYNNNNVEAIEDKEEEKSVKNSSSEEEEEEEEEEKENILYLDVLNKNNEVEELELNESEIFGNEDMNNYLIAYMECEKEKKTYYRQIENTEKEDISDELFNYELNVVPRQFLQIELQLNNESKHDIHEHISHYYVKGNTLFGEDFVMYYMKKWYNMDLTEDDLKNFRLNIIDKDINMLNLSNTDRLVLNDSSYDKISVN